MGAEALVQMLIDKGAQTEVTDTEQMTPLHRYAHQLALSIFITHDVMFHCFHYGLGVYTVWLTLLSLRLKAYSTWVIKSDIVSQLV